jgi:hypothetical protein
MDSSAHAVASTEKAERKAARELVAHYHEAELRQLLEHVRSGFLRFDAGEINAFELDEIIHRYKRAAARLWSFCGSSGGRWQQAASALRVMRERGEHGPNWWAESGSEGRR